MSNKPQAWYRFTYTVAVPASEDQSLSGLMAEQELALQAKAENPDSAEVLVGSEWVDVHPAWEYGPTVEMRNQIACLDDDGLAREISLADGFGPDVDPRAPTWIAALRAERERRDA